MECMIIDREVCIMGEIKWERDFNEAIKKAKREGKPIYHDFWFEG